MGSGLRANFLGILAFAMVIGVNDAGAATLQVAGSGWIAGDPTNNVNGAPMFSDNPFSFVGTFESSPDLNPSSSEGQFTVEQIVFHIPTYGTYTSAPDAGITVYFGAYADMEFAIASGGGSFFAAYDTVTPEPFDPNLPTPVVLSGNTVGLGEAGGELSISLEGGGNLFFKDFLNDVFTGPVQVAVPEPSIMGFVGIGLFMASARRRRPRCN